MTEMMRFGDIVPGLKAGLMYRRDCWVERKQLIMYDKAYGDWMVKTGGAFIKGRLNPEDVFADDWYEVDLKGVPIGKSACKKRSH